MLRYRMMLLAAATAAAWTNCAPAQPATSDLAAALFGSRESAKSVHLSPSGNLVSYIAPSSGGGAVGFIANVQTGDSKPFIKAGNSGEHLRWCAFVTDQRLICKYTGIADSAGIQSPGAAWSRSTATDRI